MFFHFKLPKTPDYRLNPNGRYRNQQANYRIQDQAKKLVREHTTAAPQFPDEGPVEVAWYVFWPKGGKFWDKDNLIAALKYHQDEVARAIGVNDSRITPAVNQQRDRDGKGFMLCLVSQ